MTGAGWTAPSTRWASAGLKVVLGTPTATPPRWMLDRHPDMLAVDKDGKPRGFGSRRHYCFSHRGYRAECAKIVTVLAERYGRNPACRRLADRQRICLPRDHALPIPTPRADGFRDWLAQSYQSPDALNRAWGNVFWSMEYSDFRDIGLPNLTVTEPNPSPCDGLPPLRQRRGCQLQPLAGRDHPQAFARPHCPQLTWAR